MGQFDWEDFRHFAALARTLNLGEAASVLKTSQVTVMRRVRSLEATLDTALFVRRRDGHRLTPTGHKLLALAREAEHVFDNVPDAIGVSNTKDQGHVRIATTEVGANWMLLPHVASFRAKHPGITLEIDASPHALDLLEDNETLALRFLRPQSGPHKIKRLGTVSYSIYSAKRLPPRTEKTGTTNTDRSLDYIGWSGPFSEIGIARWLRTAFKGAAPVLALTTMQGHIGAARQGIGATALPVFVGRRLHDLHEVQGDRPAFSLDAWLVVPSQISTVARIRTTAQFIEHAVRQSLDLGKPPATPKDKRR